MNVKCPNCGGNAQRDPDTMDTFVDSSWYYFRFLNPNFKEKMFDDKLGNEWTPVDMYVGGAEHATMHLLYARFIHKFLRDIGMTKSAEPFSTLIHQGTITNLGAKMSKSKDNVVNPDTFIEKYGSDVFRLYLMFMGPYDLGGDWNDHGIVGIDRFVQRTYELFTNYKEIVKHNPVPEKFEISSLTEDEKIIYRKVNQTINKYDEEINNFRFNTALASLMELINELNKTIEKCNPSLQAYTLERFAVMVSPVAPHLGEECWQLLGNDKSVYEQIKWYEPDKSALIEDKVTIAVQVNGKLRAAIEVALDSEKSIVKNVAFNEESIKRHTEGTTVVKEIFVKNKIYNIVVR